jgi:tripartite-type tricarboxylate transporter receptor subunit TctC
VNARKLRVVSVLTALLLTAACGSGSDAADGDAAGGDAVDEAAIAEFYEGETVKIIVATAPGGGFDTYARTIAPHLAEHIPGQPNVIVENMPGAGHMVAMNYLYNQAPQDGTVIGNATGGLALQQVFGSDRVQFDMRDFSYLGLPDPLGNSVLIARQGAGIESFEELLEPGGPELVVGVQSPGSLQTDPAVLLKEVLGANIKLVAGYDGSSAINLAMEQGEIDAFVTSFHTELATTREKFASDDWNVLIQFDREPDPLVEEFTAGVPTVYEFARDEGEEEVLFYGSGSPRSLTRIYFLPPNVPEERVEALQDSWAATMADPEFLADAEKAGLLIGGLSGDEVHEGLTDLLDMPEDLAARLEELIGGQE